MSEETKMVDAQIWYTLTDKAAMNEYIDGARLLGRQRLVSGKVSREEALEYFQLGDQGGISATLHNSFESLISHIKPFDHILDWDEALTIRKSMVDEHAKWSAKQDADATDAAAKVMALCADKISTGPVSCSYRHLIGRLYWRAR